MTQFKEAMPLAVAEGPAGPPATGLRSALEAATILAVGIGFGRFAFTAIYPHMVEDGLISLQQGGLIASANYAGYLVGAVLATRVRVVDAYRVCLWAIVGTAMSSAALAMPMAVLAMATIRGVAGVFSALSMVAASLWLLEHRGHFHGAPILYAGVGVGIAVSAELLVLGAHAGLHSAGLWLLLGIASLIIGLAAAPGMVSARAARSSATALMRDALPTKARSWPLVALYGLAGFGYVVTATYLPLLVRTALPQVDAAHIWAVFGLGAAPSCFLWHRIHERLGTKVSLSMNLMIQAVGVILPVLSGSELSYLSSALLVGGTFMGVVTIAMPAAQRTARTLGTNLVATMTAANGLGQIAGPLAANALYAHSQSFSNSLVAAALSLIAALWVSVWVL